MPSTIYHLPKRFGTIYLDTCAHSPFARERISNNIRFLDTLIEKIQDNQPFFLTQTVADELAPTEESRQLIDRAIENDHEKNVKIQQLIERQYWYVHQCQEQGNIVQVTSDERAFCQQKYADVCHSLQKQADIDLFIKSKTTSGRVAIVTNDRLLTECIRAHNSKRIQVYRIKGIYLSL